MIFLVAEIGVNWDGNFDLVKQMMKKSKEAGCNAVKFQAFEENTIKSHPQKSRLLKSSISESNIETIDKLAKTVGIEWFCTPMYPDAVKMLDPYVKRFKIRYGDSKLILEGKPSKLFDNVLNSGKEIIISSMTPPNKTFFKNNNTKWLYVVPKYPCDLCDLNFTSLRFFDGYSNHYPHFLAPLSAAILGAKIIEIHITSDKSKDFFDNNVSFDYDELSELMNLIRLSEKIKK